MSTCIHGQRVTRCRTCSGERATELCSHDKRKDGCSQCHASHDVNTIVSCNYCRQQKRQRSSSMTMTSRKSREITRDDAFYIVSQRCRRRIQGAMKLESMPSLSDTEQALGAPMRIVFRHLEGTLTGGMSWKRLSEMHIDHIIPLCYKDENNRSPSPGTIIDRMHYTNTQMLWARDNLRKGRRWIG